jgi:CheY-like chemotaxis protein
VDTTLAPDARFLDAIRVQVRGTAPEPTPGSPGRNGRAGSSPGTASATAVPGAPGTVQAVLPAGRVDGAPVRVVVADDADGVRELVCLLLDMEPDFTVVGWASNGAEAVDVVARTEPDLVVLDVAMPVLDGLGALPEIRREAPEARIVIFTGFTAPALYDQVRALGADALVEKGLDTGPLVDRLRTVCRGPRPGPKVRGCAEPPTGTAADQP